MNFNQIFVKWNEIYSYKENSKKVLDMLNPFGNPVTVLIEKGNF